MAAYSTLLVMVMCPLLAPSTVETDTASAAADVAATASAAVDIAAFLATAEVQALSLSSSSEQATKSGLAPFSADSGAREEHSTLDGPAAPLFTAEGMSSRSVAFCLCAFVIAGIIPVLVQQGSVPFTIILVYLLSLTLVQVLVREAVQHGMPYPYSIALLHTFTSMVVSAALEPPRIGDGLKVLPISAMTGLTLVLGSMALKLGCVPLVAKVSCGTPASIIMLEELRGRHSAPARVIVAVALVVVGAMLCMKGSAVFATGPLLLAYAACVSRSLKSVWEYDLLKAKMPPLSVVAWSSCWSFIMLLPLAAYFEGTAALVSFSAAGTRAQLAVLASALLGIGLHISQCLAIQQLGPLMQSTALNLHYVLATLSSSAWLQEDISSAQWVNTAVLVLGATLIQRQPACSASEHSNGVTLSELMTELC